MNKEIITLGTWNMRRFQHRIKDIDKQQTDNHKVCRNNEKCKGQQDLGNYLFHIAYSDAEETKTAAYI